MEGFILEWLNLLGRWVHLITGTAWIGASFYFVWLDNSLETPKSEADIENGVGGEVWSVHGGGFYHSQKYKVGPPAMPETLHWFKWEAYTTWITGMFLISLMYWYQAEIYLIDPSVMALSKPIAVLLGMLTIVIGWVAYDQLCKSSLGNQEGKLSVVMLVFVSLAAWGLCQIFSGRGAYLHYGAMLGTIMVANVFFVIMPGQRDLVAAKLEGRPMDPIHGIRAKQRSVHNTYFTLPVLFVMISNHYAMTWGHEYNWLILIALSIAGALIRVYFVQRHKGNQTVIPLVVAALIIAGTAAAITPKPRQQLVTDGTTTAADVFAKVQSVIEVRCASCHAKSPTQVGFSAPPKGVILESAEDIVRHAQTIHQQVVVTKAMPIGNLTQITAEERMLIDHWFQLNATAQ
ncbi:urate hydroxylase PuuD [Granulosicoccus sp.]|nr:urate hydroxylase PuuD [Granulosicoccus sp.]MDB4224629.1 urate hydroxylase PuuD [Granulosicoccus sp.]